MGSGLKSATGRGSPRWSVVSGSPSAPRSSELFLRLVKKGRREALDAYPTKLVYENFTAVRYGDKTAIGARSFKMNAEAVLGNTRNPDLKEGFSACVVRAYDVDVAARSLSEPSFPKEVFRVVEVSSDLWPVTRWHNQPMSETDAYPIRENERKRRLQRAAAIEAETQEYRAALERARA